MSDDLIIRSAVIKIIKDEMKQKLSYVEHNAQIDILFKIKEMPTAYDVDKVSEGLRLELGLADKEKERCAKENPLQFDEVKGYARGIAIALEIIKSGGID